jgi:hypothetical protein
MGRLSKLLIAAVGLLGVAASVPAVAAPVSPAPIENALRTEAPIQDVRLYCHRNGVFLHWGPCAHDRWKFNYYQPRPHYYHRPHYRRHYYRPRYYY